MFVVTNETVTSQQPEVDEAFGPYSLNKLYDPSLEVLADERC